MKTNIKERPILFSAPMVRAILSGQKTQTRRIVKPPRAWSAQFPHCDPFAMPPAVWWWNGAHGRVGVRQESPYGLPGDRLWVREAWRIGAWNENRGELTIDYCDGPRREWLTDPTDHDGSKFEKLWIQCCDELDAKGIPPESDGLYRWCPGQSPLRWRPSIHMPRWASRIALEIAGVRVERLQDISEADALAEGVHHDSDGWRDYLSPDTQCCPTARESYRTLWESINGAGSWGANPWVWVVEFSRI